MSSRAVLDCLMMPVQNKLEEWKKVASALDKDHAKGKTDSNSYQVSNSWETLKVFAPLSLSCISNAAMSFS